MCYYNVCKSSERKIVFFICPPIFIVFVLLSVRLVYTHTHVYKPSIVGRYIICFWETVITVLYFYYLSVWRFFSLRTRIQQQPYDVIWFLFLLIFWVVYRRRRRRWLVYIYIYFFFSLSKTYERINNNNYARQIKKIKINYIYISNNTYSMHINHQSSLYNIYNSYYNNAQLQCTVYACFTFFVFVDIIL